MQLVKRTCLALSAVFYAATGFAQDSTRTVGQTYTLQQCVDIAIKNNPVAKTAQFTMESDKALYQQSIGNMLPFANASIYHQDYNGRSLNPYNYTYTNQEQLTAQYNFNAQIVLWNGFSLLHYLRQNHEAYQAGQLDQQQAQDNTAIQVILDYLSVLSSKEMLGAALSQDSATREQLRVYTIKNQEGSIAPGDYYNLRGQLGANDIAVATAVASLQTAKLTLTKDMNVAYSASLSVTPISDTVILQPYGSSVEDMYAYSLQHLPLIKSVDLKELSALNGIKGARGNYFPTLYLVGGAATNYSNLVTAEQLLGTTQENTGQYVTVGGAQYDVFAPQSNFAIKNLGYGNQITNNINYDVGLYLSIPILSGFSTRTRVRQAKIVEEQAKFNQTTTRIQLRQSIETYYVNMTSAFETYKALRQQVDDYSHSYAAAAAKLDAGSISSYDFVLAKNNLDGATLNLIGAKYNYILQTKILDYYLGRLTI
jgi:outer membrane protein